MLRMLQRNTDGVHVATAIHVVFDLVPRPFWAKRGESVVMMGVVVAALAGGMHVAMCIAFPAFGGIGNGLAYVFDGVLDLVPDEGHDGFTVSELE